VARKVFFWTGLTFAGRAMIPMLWGAAALAYFGAGLPPANAMPRLLGTVVPPGFLGLLVAGMLAASMSTYSAYLLAWSSVLARDVIATSRRNGLSDRATIRVTRVVAIVIGLFILLFGLWYRIPDTAFQYLYVTGAMYTAGALSCVAAGIYWKRANTVGAFAGLVLGALAPAGFLLLEGQRENLPGRTRCRCQLQDWSAASSQLGDDRLLGGTPTIRLPSTIPAGDFRNGLTTFGRSSLVLFAAAFRQRRGERTRGGISGVKA
jgi:Na+/proline symporter